MTVYLVMHYDYDETEVMMVTLSQGDAEAFVARAEAMQRDYPLYPINLQVERYSVEELAAALTRIRKRTDQARGIQISPPPKS